ncbi:hypothetical protein EOD39_17123 [Acipenser ruthenus]|uniref:RNase H type-1 domain-containing protein n=1 Tax=Acipenser ruthenus TaxID=7906 RepID=A0A444V492_ACIRT|nr:hypothetical protein EOD39_17123 [Acipenser ruthenus]
MTLYVDGSRSIENGEPRTRWAIVMSDEVVASGPLPEHLSAQVAELHALTQLGKAWVCNNRRADEAAKAEARQPVPKPYAPIFTASPDVVDIWQLHAQSETAEITKWQQVGARQEDGIWRIPSTGQQSVYDNYNDDVAAEYGEPVED